MTNSTDFIAWMKTQQQADDDAIMVHGQRSMLVNSIMSMWFSPKPEKKNNRYAELLFGMCNICTNFVHCKNKMVIYVTE